MPEIVYPELRVITSYPYASPEKIANVVTKQVEQAISPLKGVKKVTSISREGLSVVQIIYHWGTNLSLAQIELRERLDLLSGYLPREVGRPIILDFHSSRFPVMGILILPELIDSERMFFLLEYTIKSHLERIEGVSRVYFTGFKKPEIKIKISPEKLARYNLGFNGIKRTIEESNKTFPVGSFSRNNKEYFVRVDGEAKRYDELNHIVLKEIDDRIITLGDVASVSSGNEKMKGEIIHYERIIAGGGLETVAKSVDSSVIGFVYKKPRVNILRTSRLIKEKLSELRKRYSGKIRIVEVFDTRDYVIKELRNLVWAISLGILFTILGVFICLRMLYLSIIIILTIPLSIVSTFLIMKLLDVSINILTLGGFTLAVGIIVDNSVIVVTSVLKEPFQNYQQNQKAQSGPPRRKSGKSFDEDELGKKVKKVTPAVVSATMTTLVVFLPVLFLSGVLRILFIRLILVLASSLIFSLLISLTLIPVMLQSKMVHGFIFKKKIGNENKNCSVEREIRKRNNLNINQDENRNTERKKNELKEAPRPNDALGGCSRKMNFSAPETEESFNKYPAAESIYRTLLVFSFKKRHVLIFMLIGVIGTGIFIFPLIDKRFIGAYPTDYFLIKCYIKSQVPLSYTKRFAEFVALKLFENPKVSRLIAFIGNNPDEQSFLLDGITGDNSVTFRVYVNKEMLGNDPYGIYSVVDFSQFEFSRFRNIDFIVTVPDSPIQQMITMNNFGIMVRIYGESGSFINANLLELKDLMKKFDGKRDESSDRYEASEGESYVKPDFSNVKAEVYKTGIVGSYMIPGRDYSLTVDNALLATAGVDPVRLGMLLRASVSGVVVGSIKRGDYDIPIRISMDDSYYNVPNDLLDLKVENNRGTLIELSRFCRIELQQKAPLILRENQKTFGWLGFNPPGSGISGFNVYHSELRPFGRLWSGGLNLADLTDGFKGKRVNVYKRLINDFCASRGLSHKYEDQFTMLKERSKELVLSFLLAIFLEYIILASIFKSFTKPLLVIFMIVISIPGLGLLLYMAGASFTITTFMGLIVLVGLLVNNAIMLFVEYGERDVRSREDIIEASLVRLKPIAITSLSTILALIPSLFTRNSIQVNLSLTLILGIGFSTILTLIFLPIFFEMFCRGGRMRNAS